jgi:hypothetical protein
MSESRKWTRNACGKSCSTLCQCANGFPGITVFPALLHERVQNFLQAGFFVDGHPRNRVDPAGARVSSENDKLDGSKTRTLRWASYRQEAAPYQERQSLHVSRPRCSSSAASPVGTCACNNAINKWAAKHLRDALFSDKILLSDVFSAQEPVHASFRPNQNNIFGC